MPVNKTGPMMKLEGAPLQALRDTVITQAQEIRELKAVSDDPQALYDKVAELEDQIVSLKQMVEDQLHEIMELRSVAGAIERNAPPNVVVDEMNNQGQDKPIGTSAIEMTAPEGDALPPLEDYPPPYDG